MIGSDRKLFDEGSAVSQRIKEYGNLVVELHIIVFATRKHLRLLKIENSKLKISNNVWVYPTNSLSRWFYPLDAIRIGKKIKATIITTQDPFECGWAGLKLKSILKVPLEVQIHTDIFSPYFSGFQNKVRKFLARTVLAKADKIRVVSNRIKDSLIERYPALATKIEVRPIQVDIDRIKNTAVKTNLHDKYKQFSKIILMASRLTKEKYIDLAIEAMPIILTKMPKVGLIIVGSGPEEEILKSKADKLRDNIVFEPWSDDLPSYYKTADLFLNTSLYEGYGMTLVEAKTVGCPVVSTDVGVAKEIGAKIISHFDPKLAAQEIIATLS